MVFGYWAIFTGVVCLAGFTYMMIEGFSEESVEKTDDASEKSE